MEYGFIHERSECGGAGGGLAWLACCGCGLVGLSGLLWVLGLAAFIRKSESEQEYDFVYILYIRA